MGNELSEQMTGFIRQYFSSLEELEILLLLRKQPDRSWTAEQVFKVTQTNIVSVADRLKSLASAGFLSAEDSFGAAFRFRPKSPELAECAAELERAYAVSKYKVVEALFSLPKSQAEHFADSFKFKRRDK
jgi:hypothetical protein